MKTIINIGVLMITLQLFVVNGYTQSLEEYLLIADQNNPTLKAKFEEFEAAMQKVPQVGSLADPTLTVATFGQMVETRVGQQMARLSLSQMFPWFGTLEAQKSAASLSAQANYESYLDTRSKLHLMVRTTYYELIEINQIIQIQRESLEILKTFKILATSKFQNGQGKLADALRANLMINELENEIAIQSMKRNPVATAFNKLLNRDAASEISIDSAFAATESIEFLRDSIGNHPKINTYKRKVESAEAMELVATKQGMPKIGLGFEYIITSKRPNMDFPDNGKDAWMPMVTVSLPIYRKKYRAAVSESQHMQQAYGAMLNATENELSTEFEMASFERDKAVERISLFDNQVQQTEQIVDLLVADFSNSATDFEEILRAQMQLLKYETAKTTSQKEFHQAQAKLIYLANEKID